MRAKQRAVTKPTCCSGTHSRPLGRIGIAKVVIKTREYLAAVKPQDTGMMLELMHFQNELIDLDEFKAPTTQTAAKKELDMAKSLIDSMTEELRN